MTTQPASTQNCLTSALAAASGHSEGANVCPLPGSPPDGQHRLGAIQRLNLALLVHPEDDRLGPYQCPTDPRCGDGGIRAPIPTPKRGAAALPGRYMTRTISSSGAAIVPAAATAS